MPNITLLNEDCMTYMRGLPDKAFDLAIVDPEYGIDAANMKMGKGKKQWVKKDWDKKTPDDIYFEELFRVSERQIIFGGNYFGLPKTGGWIVWDKDRQKDVSFSDCELLWTNFLNTTKIIKVKYDGFLGADVGGKIHPTQKPIRLYKKLLSNYAAPFTNFTPNEGDKILDTHLGSGSSAIAAHQMGFDFVGCELDKDYYDAACKRFKEQTMQGDLFK